ncbi:MAG: exodeoxyribonuclease VII small subunit [Gemmatimonadetes bacterium]|jgi:exodeoxyribonuclease VII small subunit|nr:exodeoxyribonuclease VII small subunit [Gemmatimonadota bacterium]|tara:strand:+ start:511 stop:756 length:246 start_codon:yes stop_codon:yes gene_type:complete
MTEDTEKSFEEALKDLESSVQKLETGELKLEDALSTFESGIVASKTCEKWLNQARKRIEVLMEENGEFKLEFLDDQDEENT